MEITTYMIADISLKAEWFYQATKILASSVVSGLILSFATYAFLIMTRYFLKFWHSIPFEEKTLEQNIDFLREHAAKTVLLDELREIKKRKMK